LLGSGHQDATMDIAGWLRSLGLEQYEPAFRENHVDETVLPNLTVEDLKDLGVGSIGHRRKLLEAIALLRDAADAKAPPPEVSSTQLRNPPVSEGAIPSTGGDAVGERRYLTVMFCDLVGSTGISAQLDAEEWRDLVGSYLDATSAAVTEMGGQVAKKLGDGLLALFGYPLAQENDAERAVRAALAIQRALAELNRKNAGMGKPELIARIGASIPVQQWLTRPARFTATWQMSPRAYRRSPSRALSWLRHGSSGRSPGCSWPRSTAATCSKACLSRSCFTV
jgi:hypothetical protein